MLTTNDPATAVELARDFDPDVIISDVNMPGITGPELLKRFRDDANAKSTPVIMLTGLLDDPSLTLDGVLHLAKPVRIKELTHCINHLISAEAS